MRAVRPVAQTQAERYQLTLDACLAVEDCTSLTLWGLPDQYSWVPHFFTGEGAATVLWEDFTTKPAYDVLQDSFAGLD